MASPVSASHTRSHMSSMVQSVDNSDSACLSFPLFQHCVLVSQRGCSMWVTTASCKLRASPLATPPGGQGLCSDSVTVDIVSDSIHDESSSVSADDSAASACRILRCGRRGCAAGSDDIGVVNIISILCCMLQRGLVHVFEDVRFPHRLIEWRSTAISSELRSALDMIVCRILESRLSTACSCVACNCLLASVRCSACEGVACSRQFDRLEEVCCYGGFDVHCDAHRFSIVAHVRCSCVS